MFFCFLMLDVYYQILKKLVGIQSISTDTEHTNDNGKIAIYLNSLLQDSGFASDIIYDYGNPIVLGKFSVDKSLPTMLLYGHYDVQSADFSQWRKHHPFALHVAKDKIYGRGVADNKGQFLIHLLTIFDLIHTKKLWYNVIVLLEGNEETWSQYIEQFLVDYRQDLLSDFCLISDSYILWRTPCIDVGYRWWIDVKLKITTATTDLHSWLYGGVVPNAIHEMNKILAKLYDSNNKITIPYFYYDVDDIPFDILVKNKKMKTDPQKFMTDFWIKAVFHDKDIDMLTQIGLKPTIQITWISGGYAGDGYKNAVPNLAHAHINFRIVKHQTPKKALGAFDQWLQTTLPEYLDYELEVGGSYEPVKIDTNNFYIKKAEAILERIYDQPVFYKYSGGGLPMVDILDRVLSAKPVLIPLVNEDCNAHGVDENFDVDLIEKWFQFSHDFLSRD